MKNKFIELVTLAIQNGSLKKVIFSRPDLKEIEKTSVRPCIHKGKTILAFEYFLPSKTVKQKLLQIEEGKREIKLLLESYKQANVITAFGDAEFKRSKKGKEILSGADALLKKSASRLPEFDFISEPLDKKKNYILTGSEDFLKKLGISDKDGRVHDKRQGKFRQINRFLEHIDDLYPELPENGVLNVYDLCCGKSYLSFALYYFLTEKKGREVSLLGIDLKRDVILFCDSLAKELGFSGMKFVFGDVKDTPGDVKPDMVISLHACDVATDIVIDTAIALEAGIILSTPCCHRYLNGKLNFPALSFVSRYPHLKNKLCEALTDGIRAARLAAYGYSVSVMELTDPENTPKNTLIKAKLKKDVTDGDILKRQAEYESILSLVLGEEHRDYLKEIL